MKELLERLNKLEKETDWQSIASQCSVEKQIEIRAELLRAIKRIEKVIFLEELKK